MCETNDPALLFFLLQEAHAFQPNVGGGGGGEVMMVIDGSP